MSRVTIAVVLALLGISVAQAQGVVSLRGERPVNEESVPPVLSKKVYDGEPIGRQYVSQPPLIPHAITGYQINLKFNKCLTCHSWANAKMGGATKVSRTHFFDRDGNELANISSRQYFCTQCHVPQVMGARTVENEFKPINLLEGH